MLLMLLPFLVAACGGSDDDPNNGGGNSNGNGNGNANANSTTVCSYANRLEFPKLNSKGSSLVIVHKTSDSYDTQGINYCTEWDYSLRSQRWSCYQMRSGYGGKWSRYDYASDASNTEKRQYPWDEDLNSEYYDKIDNIYGSGFDHGHICPAADRSYSFLADKQTFYMTNMQPQYKAFNSGLWSKLESQIRTWTNGTDTKCLYVCKGATIDNSSNILTYLGSGYTKTIVPKYFFCALLLENALGYKAIGFWMLNEDKDHKSDNLSTYAVSIDELELKTGLDFFCNLPDDVEADRESRCDLSAWGM